VNGVWVYQLNSGDFFPLTNLTFGDYKNTGRNFHVHDERGELCTRNGDNCSSLCKKPSGPR
jgi:hypothetical protein